MKPIFLTTSILFLITAQLFAQNSTFTINESEYFTSKEMPGVEVMVFQDFYPDGHQGGVTIVQNGERVVANGDLRLEPAPGQWSPVPKKEKTDLNKKENFIEVQLWYPDSTKNRKGFNPIIYPDLNFKYKVKVQPEGKSFRVRVDLEEELPDEWYQSAGFNLELFPGFYFGKTYMMDGTFGHFSRQFNSPLEFQNGELNIKPMAKGKKLLLVPENDSETIVFESQGEALELLDGRGEHNNGWFIVRVPLTKDRTKSVVDLLITPQAAPSYKYEPVIQVSQVGYHTQQSKKAFIELDKREEKFANISLYRVQENGSLEQVKSEAGERWGNFLRYQYLSFDFSDIEEEGIYKIAYGNEMSHPFLISKDIYEHNVWQPTLEYYLPVQMCHMRINDRYKVWHDWCHLDDARMAPTNLNHFDGYVQGPETLTDFDSGERVPGLNVGGWHDAGDYDLRVESQATTVMRLVQMRELFGADLDLTTINQSEKLVEMHRPDGIPDILQQIEHGVLTILGGYNQLGRFYRGIICSDLRQYTLLGDASSMTDNLFYDAELDEKATYGTTSGKEDDRWVFTEENPNRETGVASSLAAASRVLKGYNEDLAQNCLEAALDYWDRHQGQDPSRLTSLAVELFKTTEAQSYLQFIEKNKTPILEKIERTGPALASISQQLKSSSIAPDLEKALAQYASKVEEKVKATPYGVEYAPNIWGAGWGIQSFGVSQYMLHRGFPEIFSKEPVLSALNFVLGVHPGSNNASFVSGVGANSITVAYGVNRDEWSYIPGGSVSGTALIRPDLPELKEWPYFWQQTEYVMGGGATNFMFLALAANDMLD